MVDDGTVVEIEAGLYLGDVAVWRQNGLILRGIGGEAHVKAGQDLALGRALWVIAGDNTVIENLQFSGARGRADPAVAILVTGRGFSLRNTTFRFNDIALQIGDGPDSEVLVERSLFEWNGRWSDGIRIGRIRRLTMRYNDVLGADRGSNISSQASINDIRYNRIMDGPLGGSAALLEATGAGILRLVGNVLHKGPNASGRTALDFGRTGEAGGVAHIVNNTFVAERAGTVFVRNRGTKQARIVNNIFAGSSEALKGPGDLVANVTDVELSDFVDAGHGDYRLKGGARAIDAGIDPGSADGVPLAPGGQYLFPQDGRPRMTRGPLDAGAFERLDRNPRLLTLPANVWIKLPDRQRELPTRRNHAGAAYDPKRSQVLLFGADTHGRDFDNAIWSYDIVHELWRRAYPPSPISSYRGDRGGNRIAGTNGLFPWAMHVYDNIVYDPTLDALVVTSSAKHSKLAIAGATRDPTWIYDLKDKAWRIHPNAGKQSPMFFGAGAAYDTRRDAIVAYNALLSDAPDLGIGREGEAGRGGVWELGPDRRRWVRVNAESHHGIWFNVAYDSKRGTIAVFGDRELTNHVWEYVPGRRAGDPGRWIQHQPRGDACPKSKYFPVAFDEKNAVFLLVPTDFDAGKTVTCIYDPAANAYTRVPNANMKPLGMNFTMVYDRQHGVFLLLTGSYLRNRVANIWAFKLILPKISTRSP